MIQIDYDNEELMTFVETGKAESRIYRKFMSNATLMRDLHLTINTIKSLDNIRDIGRIRKFNYEPLHGNRAGQNSVRIGFKSKYRLIFTEHGNGIRICVIEISEHYGDK